MLRLISLIAICLVLACASAWAAPSISGVSGTATHGQSITITGTGFGTKSKALPSVWDDFETGSLGSNVAGTRPEINYYNSAWNSPHRSPVFSNTITKPNSRRSVHHDHVNDTGANSAIDMVNIRHQNDSFYISFWFYFDQMNSYWSDNIKPWLIYGNVNDHYIYGAWGEADQAAGGSYRWAVYDGLGANNHPANGGAWAASTSNIKNLEGRWVRLEQWVVQSTPGQFNGVYRTVFHTGSSIVTALDRSNVCTRHSTDQRYYHRPTFWGYQRHTNGSQFNIYTDDIYIDDTLARVEIGNAQTWGACTRREIQIPSSWSNNSITVKINQGMMPDGRAYLFVVDGSGTSSPGYPISFGGGDSQPPASPSGVNIIIGN